MRRLHFALLAVVATSTVEPSTVRAQTATPNNPSLFTRNDALLAAGFAGLTIAMFPFDKSLAHRLNNEVSKTNQFLNRASTGVEVITDPGSLVIGAALYAYGRLDHKPNIEDLGWHGTESVIVAGGTTWLLKSILGRARPYVSKDTSPRDFKLFGGFMNGDRMSFPSGHSTTAFAAAAAVTSETRRIWPGHTWMVAPAMYGGATMVALSRMYHDKHWASDVVLGAAIGTFSGIKVVRYTHAHPDNRLDRAILKDRAAVRETRIPVATVKIPLSF
ncbi:MAG: phosphatase PAP2 family protein [Gemmatimonadaceae bacterium]